MAESWKRPESLALPTTWGICEGRKPLANGKIPRFRIQDCSAEFIEPLIDHMLTYFIVDEPYCAHLDIKNDEESKKEMAEIWRSVLKYHIGLIALLDNADEMGDDSLPLIAGCNATFPTFPDTKEPDLKAPSMRSILNLVNIVSHKVDCFKKYNASVSMYAFGLSVHPAYRGQGLAEQILRARFPLCRAVGIPLTVTVFTGAISQKTGRNAGFVTLAEMKPDDYVEDGKVIFKGVSSKSVHLMATMVPPS